MRRLKQRGKALLREVVIMREDFADVPLMHRGHGYAISQTIAFVGARLVEIQPGKKVLVSLGHYFGMSICEKLFDYRDGSEPCLSPVFGKEVQHFD